jgi:hypothetical protein
MGGGVGFNRIDDYNRKRMRERCVFKVGNAPPKAA